MRAVKNSKMSSATNCFLIRMHLLCFRSVGEKNKKEKKEKKEERRGEREEVKEKGRDSNREI